MKKFSSTMRVSSRERSRNKKRLRTIVISGVVLLALFLVPKVVGFVASLVLTPIFSIQTYFAQSTATIPSYFRDRAALLEDQQSLKQKLAEHDGDAASIARLQKENEELRSLLSASSTERIGASIIGRPPALPYDSFVLDVGADKGIQENAPVYAGNDQVIGHVAQVYPDSAVVTAVTTPGFAATVYIYGPNIYTTARGVGGGVLRVSVPQGIALNEGDVVIIPALDSGSYGQIVRIDSQPTRPEQYGYVSVKRPQSSLRFVSVGRSPVEPLSFEEAKAIVDASKNALLEVPVPSGVLVDIENATTSASSTVSTSTASTSTEIQ